MQRNGGIRGLCVCLCLVVDSVTTQPTDTFVPLHNTVCCVLCRGTKVSVGCLFVCVSWLMVCCAEERRYPWVICLFVCASGLIVCCAEEQRCPWVICLFVCLCLMVDGVLCRGTKVTLGGLLVCLFVCTSWLIVCCVEERR